MADNPEIGKLCWTGGGSLAFSKSDAVHLIYKGEPVNECTIVVQFGPQSWTCVTYSCYHEIHYSASGSGSGVTVVSQYVSPDHAEFKVQPTRGSASSFTVSVVANTDCAAISKEHPGASCSASAAQLGSSPKSSGNVSCQPKVSVQITVRFDSSGKITGISR